MHPVVHPVVHLLVSLFSVCSVSVLHTMPADTAMAASAASSNCRPDTPAMLHYETLLGSLYNTPPCWSIYVCGLVFKYLLDQACCSCSSHGYFLYCNLW